VKPHGVTYQKAMSLLRAGGTALFSDISYSDQSLNVPKNTAMITNITLFAHISAKGQKNV